MSETLIFHVKLNRDLFKRFGCCVGDILPQALGKKRNTSLIVSLHSNFPVLCCSGWHGGAANPSLSCVPCGLARSLDFC